MLGRSRPTRRPQHLLGASAAFAFTLLAAPPAPAQAPSPGSTPLPNGTGNVIASSEWTILRGSQLGESERASDPANERARLLLQQSLAELRSDAPAPEAANSESTEDASAAAAVDDSSHVLLYRMGASDSQLRIVHAYSDAVEADFEAIAAPDSIQRMRDALLDALQQQDDTTANYLGATTATFADNEQPVTLLQLQTTRGEIRRLLDVYVVPAGERLQYFEASYDADDADGAASCAQLIGTFDGMREPESRGRGLMIGAVAGAVAGMLAAMLRRRRQAKTLIQPQTGSRGSAG
ncbi:MAG: hypothetical protein AB8H80_20625 [Planctomycetota bacterium]